MQNQFIALREMGYLFGPDSPFSRQQGAVRDHEQWLEEDMASQRAASETEESARLHTQTFEGAKTAEATGDLSKTREDAVTDESFPESDARIMTRDVPRGVAGVNEAIEGVPSPGPVPSTAASATSPREEKPKVEGYSATDDTIDTAEEMRAFNESVSYAEGEPGLIPVTSPAEFLVSGGAASVVVNQSKKAAMKAGLALFTTMAPVEYFGTVVAEEIAEDNMFVGLAGEVLFGITTGVVAEIFWNWCWRSNIWSYSSAGIWSRTTA